jgi:hypothetical protein
MSKDTNATGNIGNLTEKFLQVISVSRTILFLIFIVQSNIYYSKINHLIEFSIHTRDDCDLAPIISLLTKFSKAGFHHPSDRISSHYSPKVPYLKQFFIQCNQPVHSS